MVRAPRRRPFEDDSQAVRDLGALAALCAFHRLIDPVRTPKAWNELVMSSPRKQAP